VKILVVLTGGTISTVEQDGVMGIHGNSPYALLEKYEEIQERVQKKTEKEIREKAQKKIQEKEQGKTYTEKQKIQSGEEKEKENTKTEFTVIEPVRMLSECNRPCYLERIYYGILEALGMGNNEKLVRKAYMKRDPNKETALEDNMKEYSRIEAKREFAYDGIIVTHGSDTLSYTAAFLSVAFSWIPIPLVLTAADYPLSNPHSNGMKNFTDAVDFIRKKHHPGVFAVWQNKTGGANLYHASQLLEAGTGNDCFSSFHGQPFGEIQDGNIRIFNQTTNNQKETSLEICQNGIWKEKNCKNAIQEENNRKIKVLDFHMEHDVLLLRPYPGLRYDLISLENTNIKAVVHYLYHSATACTEGEKQKTSEADYNILSFAKYCKNLGIDFYAAGFKSKTQALYETNDLLLKSGLAKPLYQVSPELAYMKVLIAYNQTLFSKDEIL
jgi:L-asparaginase